MLKTFSRLPCESTLLAKTKYHNHGLLHVLNQKLLAKRARNSIPLSANKKTNFPFFSPVHEWNYIKLPKLKFKVCALKFFLHLKSFHFFNQSEQHWQEFLWQQSVRCMTGEVSLFVLSWHLCSVAVCWLEHVMSTGIWLNLQSSSKSFKGCLLDNVIYLNNSQLLYG